ncbi:MAG TPA: acetate--CoA ligase family protein [Streptosporangiaceae bacterium]
MTSGTDTVDISTPRPAASETRAQIHSLLAPRSIAIVGAGSSPGSIGSRAVSALVDGAFGGDIYPINPKRDEIQGVRAYPSLLEVPGEIDVAEVLLSAEATPGVLRQAAKKGVRNVVLLNAGFAEAGRADLQDESLRIARQAGIRLVGPNCAGLFNVHGDARIGFMPAFRLGAFREGHLALAIQSGGVLTNVLNKAFDLGVGLTTAASTGNEPDLTWLDMLDYQVHDPATRAVAVYAEGIPDGRELIRVLEDARRLGKRIVMLRGGTSDAGMRAAQSHTGAIASSARVFTAVCRELDVTLVDELDDLLAIGAFLARRPDGQAEGGVGVITTSGGAAVMSVDALSKRGAAMAQLSEGTRQSLQKILPSFATTDNPVDISAQYLNDPSLFQRTLRTVAGAPEVSSVVVSLGMVADKSAEIFADAIIEEADGSEKDIVVCWTGGSLTSVGQDRLSAAGRPAFQRLDTCAHALSVAHPEPSSPAGTLDDQGQRLVLGPEGLDEAEVGEFLQAKGVTVAQGRVVHSVAEALEAFGKLGPRVVMKICSPEVLHKSDVGGVFVGVASAGGVEEAMTQLEAVHGRLGLRGKFAVFVQRMVSGAVAELIVGLRRDPQFGWMVVAGIGGIFTEVLDDVALRLAPVSVEGARAMLDEMRGAALLNGSRNTQRADVPALAAMISRLSQIAGTLDGIESLELNPVLVLPEGSGAVAVDALASREG